MEQPPPEFPYGEGATTSHGVSYKWDSYAGDTMYSPSVEAIWTEKGLSFDLTQAQDGGTRLRVESEVTNGNGTKDIVWFDWSESTWRHIPESVRQSVERACRAITRRSKRDTAARESAQRERDAAWKTQEGASRKRILEQLED